MYERGRRLLPATLDFLAEESPGRLYAIIPKDGDLSHGFRNITVVDVSKAVHSCAWWICDTFGPTHIFETIAYVGLNDLCYPVFWFAAIKCGYKVLLLSPRNTVKQNVSLLRQTECNKFFYAPQLSGLAVSVKDAFKDQHVLSITPVASFDEWLSSFSRPYEYQKTFDEAKNDPVIVLHSSGSTGDPKPITNTNGYFAAADRLLPPVEGRELGGIALLDYEGGGSYYSPFPGFHLAGITALAFYPIMMRSASLILGQPERPPSIDVVCTILTEKQPRVLYLPPSIIEALCQIPSALEAMKNAESVVFAGGPLARPVGDMLSKHVKLSSSYGSTEIGNVPCLLPNERQDWEWLSWHPALKIDMEPSVDQAYELVLKRDPNADQYRAIGSTILQNQKSYRSRDLFTAHETKPNMWQFHSRNDDIIVLSSGEKWNPIPSEGMIQSHPKLTGAFIIGNGKFQPAVLLEPKDGPESTNEFIQEVWPLIEKANAASQRFGRLSKTKVAVVEPGSFIRAPKGTVVRKSSLEKFKDVVENLYAADTSESVALNGSSAAAALSFSNSPQGSEEDLKAFVRDCVRAVSSIAALDDEADLYTHGLDSLETLEIAKALKRGLLSKYSEQQLAFLTAQTVFRHPSIQRLAASIWTSLNPSPNSDVDIRALDLMQLDEFVDFYAQSLPTQTQMPVPHGLPSVLKVGLTGSTGSLGQHILTALFASAHIGHIVCLDRSPETARSRAGYNLAKTKTEVDPKISFLKADISSQGLGLSETDSKLLDDVDILIHNVWKVNFNQTLSSFEPLVASASHIARWAAGRPMKLVFVSSIAAVSNFSEPKVPEQVIEDSNAASSTGYGQSKQAAERLFARAAQTSGTPVTILRVGQIAGSVYDSAASPSWETAAGNGAWNKNEWVPALIQTSKNLRCIPAEMPIPVDWIPVNVLAKSIIEIVADPSIRRTDETSLTVYNIVNPHLTTWSSLLPTIQSSLTKVSEGLSKGSEGVRALPYAEWLAKLQRKSENLTLLDTKESGGFQLQSVEEYPAVKIMPFFEELGSLVKAHSTSVSWELSSSRYKTDLATQRSQTLRQLEAIQPSWVSKWISQWNI